MCGKKKKEMTLENDGDDDAKDNKTRNGSGDKGIKNSTNSDKETRYWQW